MGGRVALPDYDEYTKRAAVLANLKPKEVAKFYKVFKKLDKEKKGLVPLDVIFLAMEDGRTLYTDTLLEMLEIEHDGRLTFSGFFLMVTTYCLFEPPEMLKFCFFVFDQDKTGYFEEEELKTLMNSLHKIKPGETVVGNTKFAWQSLPFSEYDDRIEFDDFTRYSVLFPRLFAPAQMLQIRMMTLVCGSSWWERKKRELHDLKMEDRKKEAELKLSEEKKKERARIKKVKKKMGLIGYFCCPCFRYKYRDFEAEAAYERAMDEKLKRKQEILKKQRELDLKIKNPVTDSWVRFEKKIEPEKGGSETFIPQKEIRMERMRVTRGEERANRRKERLKDPDLNPKVKKKRDVSILIYQ